MEPVAVFHESGVTEGLMPATERRLTDVLTAGEMLRIDVTGGADQAGDWIEFAPDAIVAVAVPPRPEPSSLRVARRRHLLEIRAGPYLVAGTAHMPIGSDPLRYVNSVGRQWLPLTDCTVERGAEAWKVDVVIVNLDHVSRADAGTVV
jgi:hypothetical protein